MLRAVRSLEAWLRITQSVKIFTPRMEFGHWLCFHTSLVPDSYKGFPEQFDGLSHTRVEPVVPTNDSLSEVRTCFLFVASVCEINVQNISKNRPTDCWAIVVIVCVSHNSSF